MITGYRLSMYKNIVWNTGPAAMRALSVITSTAAAAEQFLLANYFSSRFQREFRLLAAALSITKLLILLLL